MQYDDYDRITREKAGMRGCTQESVTSSNNALMSGSGLGCVKTI
jgi:hypothetical protein